MKIEVDDKEHFCPHGGERWRNREGYFTTEHGHIICLDWDERCDKCLKQKDEITVK